MNSVKVNLYNKSFVVTIVRLIESDHFIDDEIIQKINTVHAMIINFIKKQFDDFYNINVNTCDLLLLLQFDETTPASIQKATAQALYEEIGNKINKIFGINVVFSCGKLCDSPNEISVAYNQANNILLSKIETFENTILWYDDFKLKENVYFYPEKLELKLRTAAKQGDIEEMRYSLSVIYEENYKKRVLSRVEHEMLIADMHATYLLIMPQSKKCLSNTYEEQEFLFQLSLASDKEGFGELHKKFMQLCEENLESKTSKNDEIVDDIINYLQQNYCKSELSLQSMATHFNLNDVYVSSFFKKHIGENFSSYVENMRIDKAKKLMLEKKYSIAEIAELVGYNNVFSFRRAFKKITGNNPSEFYDK